MRVFGLIFSLLLYGISQASHLVGGELYYKHLGQGWYLVGVTMYRDCYTTGFNSFDDQLFVSFYDAAADTLIQVGEIFPSSPETFLPVVIDVSCLADTPDICIARLEYADTFWLDVPPGGIHLVNQRCCRTPSAVNVQSPADDYGSTYYAFIPPPALAVGNSSPRFNKVPPKLVCAEVEQSLDYSATDADGDSLSYSFCTPFHGGGKQNSGPFSPSPPVPTAPPFDTVAWAFGFNRNYQISSNPNLTIDQESGLISLNPDQISTYLFAVCVREYRDGNFLSENRRDFQITTTACTLDAAAAIDSALEECIGLNIDFVNTSSLGLHYLWDFGDESVQSDTSSAVHGTYTFPDTGLYTVRLVAFGDVCSDTAYFPYRVLPKIKPEFEPPVPDCFDRHRYLFEAAGDYRTTTVARWVLDSDTLLRTGGELSVFNHKFNRAGTFPVTLIYTDFGCLKQVSDTVTVFANPELKMVSPAMEHCSPFHSQLNVAIQNAFATTFVWHVDTLESVITTESSLPVSIQQPGQYDVAVEIRTAEQCVDTVRIMMPHHITVLDTPVAAFVTEPVEAYMFTPYFTVTDSSLHSIKHLFRIASLGSFSDSLVLFEASDTGKIDIDLVCWHENGCADTVSKMVRVVPEFLVFTPNSFTPDGDGINDGWLPEVFVCRQYELTVADRWGHAVFASTDKTQPWFGDHVNGAPCPNGVYAYVMKVQDEDFKWHKYEGTVTLSR